MLIDIVSISFPFGSKRITQWHGRDQRQLELFYPPLYLNDYNSVPSITVRCRKFRPAIGDVVTKSYPTSQGPCILDLPPFTLIDLLAVRSAMNGYVSNHLEDFAKELKIGVVGEHFGPTFDEISRVCVNVSSSKYSNLLNISACSDNLAEHYVIAILTNSGHDENGSKKLRNSRSRRPWYSV